MRHTVPTLVCLSMTAAALADPVVVRFDGDPNEVALRDIDPALPDLVIYEWVYTGAGTTDHQIEIAPADVAGRGDRCGPAGAAESLLTDAFDEQSATPLGVAVPGPDASGDWTASYQCAPSSPMPSFTLGDTSYFAFPCDDWFPPFPFTVEQREDVRLFPLRVPEGAGFRYGWTAVQLTRISNDTCDPDFGPPPLVPRIVVLAAAFETEPETPIVVGGGLCEADLTLDAVLDLADIQAFVEGFVGQHPSGDLNGDGVFDLSDVQVFVGAFSSGCGL